MENDNFDAISYFKDLTEKNLLASNMGFIPVVISNSNGLEGLLEEFRDNDRFVAISDTSSGNLSSNDGTYGFFNRRAYTVFIIAAYEWDNMIDRQEIMGACRKIFHQFVSRIIRDKYLYEDESATFFDTHAIPNQEIGKYYLSGMTGLHFTVYMEEPVDLEYDNGEWKED